MLDGMCGSRQTLDFTERKRSDRSSGPLRADVPSNWLPGAAVRPHSCDCVAVTKRRINAMSRTYTSFTFRLDRTPSSWTEISSSLLSATATVVATTVVYQTITHAARPVSPLWWSLFGGLA